MCLPEILPSSLFESEWITPTALTGEQLKLVTAEMHRVAKAPGWNPKIIKLGGDLVAVDLCCVAAHTMPKGSDSVLHSVHVLHYVDHPFLKELPAGTPRAVKSLYRKEVRMAHFRADEYWPYHYAIEAAEKAWETFLQNSR